MQCPEVGEQDEINSMTDGSPCASGADSTFTVKEERANRLRCSQGVVAME